MDLPHLLTQLHLRAVVVEVDTMAHKILEPMALLVARGAEGRTLAALRVLGHPTKATQAGRERAPIQTAHRAAAAVREVLVAQQRTEPTALRVLAALGCPAASPAAALPEAAAVVVVAAAAGRSRAAVVEAGAREQTRLLRESMV